VPAFRGGMIAAVNGGWHMVGGEQIPVVTAAARARSLQGQMPVRGLGRRLGDERGSWCGWDGSGAGAGVVGMALAAGGLRMSREKRTAVSGQHVQRVRMGKHLRAQ
jgi:hypothetical protein